MFTDVTYQDYLAAEDKESLLLRAVERYRRSGDFARALEAAEYFRGRNTAVSRKTVLRACKL